MLNTIKSLEAELEVERSALQDAKFSHDVSQLRLKEMERNVEEERAINHQLAADLSELKETVSRLKHSLEEQEKRGTLLRDQLERYRIELMITSRKSVFIITFIILEEK